MMKFLQNIDRGKITMAGLFMAAVLFLAVNIFANSTFTSMRLDLTEDKLYTISAATRNVLGSLVEPIKIRLYFSKILAERSPRHAAYYTRIRELLKQYQDISSGKIQLELKNPEPFSDAEDSAVTFGLKGIPVNAVGDLGYFGLAATNSTDGQKVVAFFNREREQFIEYDLTKLIYTLAHPEKKMVGLLSSMPINGARDNQGRQLGDSWMVIKQISDLFNIITVDPASDAIPGIVDILMIVHPKTLSEKMLYAIDQFVLGGGKALVFVDPNFEVEMLTSARTATNAGPSKFNRILNAWGVTMLDGKIAGDLDAARRVNAGMSGQVVVADYVAWLKLGENNFDKGDVISAGIRSLNMATAGILEKVDGASTKMTPIVTTSNNSMKIAADKIGFTPDVVALFRDFRPEGKPLTLAARLKGKVKSAFPDGEPKDKKPAKETSAKAKNTNKRYLAESIQPINVIVVADADMLHDRFWLQRSNFMGQQVLIPFANNADFVVNALDNLGGSNALIGLRGRGRTDRPFFLVDNIRRKAERNFRAKEKQLLNKLKDAQSKLDKVQKNATQSGNVVLSLKDKASLDGLRTEMVVTRKELRNVQHELRKDIEQLDGWLKFLNILAVPLLLGVVMLTFIVFKRSRRDAKAMAR